MLRNFQITARPFFGSGEMFFNVKAGTAELAEASITMQLESAGYYVYNVRLI